jgi:hypothetical protein
MEATEKNEPTEKNENADPTEPIDKKDPTEPIESIDPFEPIERNESSDHSDQRELDGGLILAVSRTRPVADPPVGVAQARSAMTAMAALRPFSAITLPAGWVAAPQR